MVAHLRSGATPFLSTVMGMNGVQKVTDPDFKMFEDASVWYDEYFDVNEGSPDAWTSSGAPGGTVTVGADGVNGVAIDASLVNLDVEIWDSTLTTYKGTATVTAVSGSDVTLKNTGGLETSATFANSALADDDRCFVIGTAFGEGSDAPDAYSRSLSVVWNSCADEKTTLEITTATREAALRGGMELANLRTDRLNAHKIRLEKSIFLSVRAGGIGGVAHGAGGGTDSTFRDHQTDADGKEIRKMMGIFRVLERYGISDDTSNAQNVFVRSFADYDYSQFVKDADKSLQYDPNVGGMPTVWCGNEVINHFAALEMAKNSGWEINVTQELTALGVTYNVIKTGRATFRAIEVPWWRGRYGGRMLRLDPENVQPVHFEQAFEYSTNIKTDNKPRSQKDEYYSSLGLKFKQVKRSSMWKFS